MDIFLSVVLNIIIPMLILVLIGYVLQIKFTFNLKALSNLLTYCLMPAAVFITIYQTEIQLSIVLQLLTFILLFSVVMIIISTIIAKLLQLTKPQSAVLKNSIVLINSGNYGLPVSQLIFHSNPLGVSIQIIIVVYQNLLTFTYGIFNLASTTKSSSGIIRELFRLPIMHAIILGAALNAWRVPIPFFIWTPLSHLGDGFIAVALITLGAQLTQIEFRKIINRLTIWSAVGRLIIGPMIALAIILVLRLDGVVAQSLFIASSFPTSRNSSTLALEYEVDPPLAAQTVIFSTVLSSITVAFVIFLSTILFPH